MGKRANGEGSFRQKPNGRREGRLSYTHPETGDIIPVSVSRATKADCRRELKKIFDRLEEGLPAKDGTVTLAEWLKTWRESSLAASDRAETTKDLYESLSIKHLEKGDIGAKRIDRLKPSDMELLLVELRDEKGLAQSTIRSTYTVLRGALDIAVRDGLLASNPAAKVKRPTVTHKEAEWLPAADVTQLLKAASTTRYYVAVLVMATTGLRRGEVCGLAWVDVDLDKGELRVQKTVARTRRKGLVVKKVKTDRSRRRVPLLPAVVTALKEWRIQQVKERLAAGDRWDGEHEMVFLTELGTLVDPRNVLRAVEIAAKKIKYSKTVGAHTMRHSAAAAWLEDGTHIKAVADLLGHGSIAITGDLYGHTSDETARAAVDRLGKALGL